MHPTPPDPTTSDAPLVARGVTARYGDRTVLRDVDLVLEHGEIVALLGPNGVGKTTLVRSLVGSIAPTSGRVVRGDAVRVGWSPQGGATYARLTVRENLELFARLLRLADPVASAAAAARTADLEDRVDDLAGHLSGGMRQRLNVAAGLLGDPHVLVLDEPMTGVDLHHRVGLFRLLRDRARAGASVLYSTHSIEDAEPADRVVVLVDGAVAWTGTVDGLALLAPDMPHAEGEPADPRARGLLHLWRTDVESPAGTGDDPA